MLLLIAGHHPLAKGAGYNDHYEHDEAVLWVSEIANLVRGRMMVDIVPTGRVSDKVKWVNTQNNVSLVCEVHFNSDASKRQHGSETLYCPGSSHGKSAAEVVQAALAGIFPPSRGVKEGWYRQDRPDVADYPGDINGDEDIIDILDKTTPVTIVVEPEFIYNWEVLQDRRHPACGALTDALVKAALGITERN
ncbi:MAG: hypothetical protein A2Y72_02225 [Chloroflexi bacterium RBG_13_53_26]|nr:MAG: hypothetical protein A2Y72_02225 [Chloroflexi bacterium RBG_13_53_26]